jgi:hypothetical protein
MEILRQLNSRSFLAKFPASLLDVSGSTREHSLVDESGVLDFRWECTLDQKLSQFLGRFVRYRPVTLTSKYAFQRPSTLHAFNIHWPDLTWTAFPRPLCLTTAPLRFSLPLFISHNRVLVDGKSIDDHEYDVS